MEKDRVGELETRLSSVEDRLKALELAAGVESAYEPKAAGPMLGDGFASSASTHLGRILLIFGGAYLLRAITEGNFVPTAVGIFLGAGYAVLWLFQAYRKARVEDQRAAAVFFGASSVLLTLPLLVEAVATFGLLSGPQAVLALTVYSALTLAVAATRNLRSLAWILTAGGIGTAVALLIITRAAVPAAAFLLVLAFGVLWLVYAKAWVGVQWIAALGCNAGILTLALLGRSDQWTIGPRSATMFAGVALIAYLLSFAFQTYVRDGKPGLFEVVQALALTGIAFVVASVAPEAGQPDPLWIGVPGLVLGIGGYSLAFSAKTRATRGPRYYFYSGLGLVLVVASAAFILPAANAALLWAIMAVIFAWLSGRLGWVSLSLHCSVLVLAAGIGSGILTGGWHAFTGDAAGAWPAVDPWHIGIALATVACLFIPVTQQSERWGKAAGLPQLTVLAMSVWEVGGLMVAWSAPILAGAGSGEADPALLAALRTAVLSAAAVTLAVSSRHRRWPEARWLVYPVLALVGIKLFIEDFPNGQPATLFVALAFVGGALLLVARLLTTTGEERHQGL